MELTDRLDNDENGSSETEIRISPMQYLRVIYRTMVECFKCPNTTSIIDYYACEVRRE